MCTEDNQNSEPTLLQLEGVTKFYGAVRAADAVSFSLRRGGMTALVGESGSGKSTLARLILRLEEPDAGRILFEGTDFTALTGSALRGARKDVQMIFQDPHASLNPRMKVKAILEEPLKAQGVARKERMQQVRRIMERTRIPEEFLNRYAHELSGGQRQRIGVARALVLEPKLVIADEPTAALDVSIQAKILDLLREMRRELDFTLLFISHDLAVVYNLCDHVIVMRSGRVVEEGPRDRLFNDPREDYTRELLAAAPG
ncbi:MAG: ABC transporter ATP-binding protein [Verrucomicrobia bacterium]|nr:ABC transporter ATP-binding protein [Verrucomicrobiota bacterium]MCH8527246.1 ATP-binding cassette domain-containing protein [Kiritimatiellia bacterium]